MRQEDLVGAQRRRASVGIPEYYCCGGLAVADEEFAAAVPGATGTAEAEVEVPAGAGLDDAVFALEPECGSGLGASTPAVLEPRPSFCRLGASSLPLAFMPLSDWNFCRAATVFESHLPLGWPW